MHNKNDPIALSYINKILSDINLNRDKRPAASSSSIATSLPHPELSLYQRHYNDELYQKILPICRLAYLEEKNGITEDHALKLSLIFEHEKAAYDYLIKFPKGNDFVYLVHDASLFGLSPADNCNFLLWKKIAAKGSNMLNPRFRQMLPYSGAIKKINSVGAPMNVSTHDIKEKERELSALIKAFH